jgi:1-acyl-sn-glycerol-3-phosphate acyltransferase
MPRSAFLEHPLRATGRLLWLGAELAWTALDYPLRMAFAGRHRVHTVRALWLQRHCRRISRALHLSIHTSGPTPTCGLLASNHLSYLDILLLGTITPSVFVAKREVRQWPLFGWFAHLAGTVFVDRERRSDALRSSNEIRGALERGSLVVIFPEGTSTGGKTVLPFKSALLREAENPEYPAYACCIRYALPEGDAEEEVCFWRDMALVPHLLNLLGRPGIEAKVSFAHLGRGHSDRKHLSRLLHREVLRMHSGGAPAPIPMGWDEIITGYDFGLLTAGMILTWVRDAAPQGPAGQCLAAMTGDEVNFEERLWAACQEATGALPRPGTEKWGAAQDRWRKALLREAYDPTQSPEDLGKVVEEIYERVGCPEDMRDLWNHASPWEHRPAVGYRDKVEAFLRET